MKRKFSLTYITAPKYQQYLSKGYRLVKEYDTFCLMEKVEKGEVLYRECFHNFDLFGAEWALETFSEKEKAKRLKRMRAKR